MCSMRKQAKRRTGIFIHSGDASAFDNQKSGRPIDISVRGESGLGGNSAGIRAVRHTIGEAICKRFSGRTNRVFIKRNLRDIDRTRVFVVKAHLSVER